MERRHKWLSTDDVVRVAEAEVSRYLQTTSTRFKSLSEIGQVGPALLVENLGTPGEAYYLVPWEVAEGAVLIAQLDARTGELQSIAEQRKPNPLTNVEGVLGDLRRMSPETTPEPQRWVWIPCRETPSPLLPLLEVKQGDDTFYIRADGRVFRNLTTTGKGG